MQWDWNGSYVYDVVKKNALVIIGQTYFV